MAELRRQAVAVEDHLLEGWEDQQADVLNGRKDRTLREQGVGCVLHLRPEWNEQLLRQEEHSNDLDSIHELRCFVLHIDRLQQKNLLNTFDMTSACTLRQNMNFT